MAVVSEMVSGKEAATMSLAEMREHLGRVRQGGGIKPGDQARLASKMKEVMSRLAKLGQRGGGFAEVQLSDEAKELYDRSRWS